MSLPQLPKLKSINGDKNEENRKLRNVEAPEQNRDAANKKWVEDNFTPL